MAWLLGRELIASFKGTLLFTAYGSKLDARDWMNATEYPSPDQEAAEHAWQKMAERSWQKKSRGVGGKGGEEQEGAEKDEKKADFWKERGEFWFDYISDTGDGMCATYSIAYLSTCDLWAAGRLADLQQQTLADLQARPCDDERLRIGCVGFIADSLSPPTAPRADAGAEQVNEPEDYPNASLNLADGEIDKSERSALPRGQFLLVGGDTTYHLSDYESLHKRFQNPFIWAHTDAERDGRLLKDDRRPLFGIPGNHDYYDQLDGFRRQFRKPIRADRDLRPGRELEAPQLMLPGFVRKQEASYVALRLPFGWQFWGLDTELGKIDERQQRFFRNIAVVGGDSIEEGAKPRKLIVATCAPTTVFGKYADKDDEKSAKAFYQLGLPRPFLNPKDKRAELELENERGEPSADRRTNELEAGQCRLDLSGDIHLYARYWGRPGGPSPRGNGAPREACEHYASVVSGIGGAFHHPTTTYAGEVCEQVLWPPSEESRKAVADNIFDPWWIAKGGGVWAIGFVIAFLLYFAATISGSSGGVINNFGPLLAAGIVSTPTPPPAAAAAASEAVAPPDYGAGGVMSFAALVLILYVFALTNRFRGIYWKQEELNRRIVPPPPQTGVSEPRPGRIARLRSWSAEYAKATLGRYGATSPKTERWYKKLMWQYSFWAYVVVALAVAALAGAILIFKPEKESIPRFGNSLLVLSTLVWGTVATVTAVRYSDWLRAMASKITIGKPHWLLVQLLVAFAVLGIVSGFAIFGLGNNAADMTTDILLTLVVAAVLLVLTEVGRRHFGKVKSGPARWGLAAFGLAFGLFHAVLQLVFPFLLVHRGSRWAWVGAVVLVLLAMIGGKHLMRSQRYRLLPVLWVFYGAAMLSLPYVALKLESGTLWGGIFGALRAYEGEAPLFVTRVLTDALGVAVSGYWDELILCFVAGFVGLAMSCVWIGWYFATALVCHGHNNEAGGAARIERFKQFIRFRLTENDLTGFVIAVDDPEEDGNKLRPRLVDVIYLTLKPEPDPPDSQAVRPRG